MPGCSWQRDLFTVFSEAPTSDERTKVNISGEPLRDAAFGDAPEGDVARLLADGAPTPVRRWLAAVAFGGQGRYAAATALLTSLLATEDPVIGSLAASTLAAHRRQLGGHAAAQRLDGFALRRIAGLPLPAEADPDGVDVTGARVDALLGLAADAIGLGRPALARRLLRPPAGIAGMGWRSRVRSGWVNAETLLAEGEPEQGVAFAEQAVAISASCGAVRHVIKSEMVLSVTQLNGATERGCAAAIGLLERVVARSLESDLLPLAWPSALLLAETRPEAAHYWCEQARRATRLVLSRADAEGRRIATRSLWFPNPLLQIGERAATEGAQNFLTD
jgi:hypothetical protein